MTKEQILSLLDMSEVKKYEWLQEHKIIKHVAISKKHRISFESLADLAFRKRNEVNETDQTRRAFNDALYTIQEHLDKIDWATSYWGLNLCQPIHWITAALLAGLENDK